MELDESLEFCLEVCPQQLKTPFVNLARIFREAKDSFWLLPTSLCTLLLKEFGDSKQVMRKFLANFIRSGTVQGKRIIIVGDAFRANMGLWVGGKIIDVIKFW